MMKGVTVMDARDVGLRVEWALRRAGLTQAELAARVHVAPSHISRLINGSRPSVNLDLLGRIAAELGTSVESLLGQEPPSPPDAAPTPPRTPDEGWSGPWTGLLQDMVRANVLMAEGMRQWVSEVAAPLARAQEEATAALHQAVMLAAPPHGASRADAAAAGEG
jgi:transcriptional regulator with XRE-family HTH domain